MIDLRLGDCLEIMKTIPDKSVDLVLTDPDYNAKDIGPKHREYYSGMRNLPQKEYKSFCKEWFRLAKLKVKNNRIVFTPGISNTHNYPQPYWQIAWHKPAAVSFNRMGGFNAWEPVFCYSGPAKGKHIGQDYMKVNTLNFSKGPERNHPCPKVLGLWYQLVEKFSLEGDVVLDPFLGSGTTAVVCKMLKRNCIGIDIEQKYIDIAKRRINQTMENLL